MFNIQQNQFSNYTPLVQICELCQINRKQFVTGKKTAVTEIEVGKEKEMNYIKESAP